MAFILYKFKFCQVSVYIKEFAIFVRNNTQMYEKLGSNIIVGQTTDTTLMHTSIIYIAWWPKYIINCPVKLMIEMEHLHLFQWM